MLHAGDCREVMRSLESTSVDAVVTDPPYELGFMGKRWDSSGIAYDVTVWRECLRLLKPGGYLLAFGGTRTYHRLGCAVEDAGFEIRDSLHWIYGSGFPKGKTSLKPAHEPIVLAHKPASRSIPFPGLDGCRTPTGRWPPNVLLSPEAAIELDQQSGHLVGCGGPKVTDSGRTSMFGIGAPGRTYEREGGGASRFFPVFRYQAKAGTRERPRLPNGTTHPTVKPVALMRWLVRLVTPPGGLVLDPFAGTGATGEACAAEGFRCILIEQDPLAIELARIRLSGAMQPLF